VGIASYFVLPVASLPNIDTPAIGVSASVPGASPEVMATSVATPLERRLGQIASVSEMTSQSSTGRTQVVLIFDLERDINGAARDVEAAINAAKADLPQSALRNPPSYRKFNPADAPIVILDLTSATMTQAQMYDAAAVILEQKLSQVQGVGSVDVSGGASPAVRIDLNPTLLSHYGIGLEDVRAAVAASNANSPKGMIASGGRRLQLYTNDQGTTAADYQHLLIAYRNGAAVRLSDVAAVYDGPEDIRNVGLANGKDAIIIQIRKEPGANVIDTVNRINALLPQLRSQLPPAMNLQVSVDRTITIRGSLFEVERTLIISIILVVLVVLLFLRNGRATLIPGVAVTVSLLGTLAVMYIFKFSLDNLSLMALTVATGFVVDDAIVVLENITRHVEAGMPRFKAALVGAGEVGFTVISISISLIAVFIPILMMGGIIGRMFREFAMTLSAAVLISLVISLTATPMMAARLIDDHETKRKAPGPIGRFFGRMGDGLEKGFTFLHETYEDSLTWALDNSLIVLIGLFATVALTVYLYINVQKGFFPQQDTGQLQGGVQVDQAASFRATSQKFRQIVHIIGKDPSVQNVIGFSGGNGGGVFVALKPKADRPGETSDDVITRLRPKLFKVQGAQTFLQTVQDVRVGGRQSNAAYQYTLESDDLGTLKSWTEKLTNQLKTDASLTDVNSDQQEHGLETYITVDHDTATRLGLTSAQIDNVLNDAFSQRQVSVIYNPLNQYHVVMGVAPQYSQTPEAIRDLYASATGTAGALLTPGSGPRAQGTGQVSKLTVATAESLNRTQPFVIAARGASTVTAVNAVANLSAAASSSSSSASSTAATGSAAVIPTASTGAGVLSSSTGGGGANQAQTGSAVSTVASRMTPFPAFSIYAPNSTPTAVNHQDQSVAATVSFNLAPGKSLSDAQTSIAAAVSAIHMPSTVVGGFKGTAQLFADSFKSQPLLILAALVAVYIVLGVLYESYIHPITVLSTLPSAGVGAVAALMLFQIQFDIIALIGVILLIGIVKKNAIMIIDFALVAERDQGLSTRDAIYQACMLRFRPILMTTMAAILGALPLAMGLGEGGELRRPLGVAIIGGLVASQMLTLLTTPVVYLYMDRLRKPRPRTALGDRLRGRRPPGPAPVSP
jgi:multidrug efflux pump